MAGFRNAVRFSKDSFFIVENMPNFPETYTIEL